MVVVEKLSRFIVTGVDFSIVQREGLHHNCREDVEQNRSQDETLFNTRFN